MAPTSQQEIEAAVKEELAGTEYAVKSTRVLTGGTANFIFHVQLEKPLSDGTAEVAIKHGEAYIAQSPGFALSTERCVIEEESLRFLAQLPPSTSPACSVATPKLYHFNPKTSTQIQEYLPHAVSLKDYALRNSESLADESKKPRCVELGYCLGEWLRRFHSWSDDPANSGLRDIFVRNKEMQQLKRVINYDWILSRADKNPELLEECRPILQAVSDMSKTELEDETKLSVIHGDFWTGNVLLPDLPLEEGTQIQVRVVDWEMAQLSIRPEDLGQMIAELWELKLYKDIDAGLWNIQGLMQGYGARDEEFAFRTMLHVGAHLISFGSVTPGWGDDEQRKMVLRTGRDVLVKAWEKDRRAFDGHDLECVFPQ